jgi:50S ribosomal subunit-associated GTPase HflX
MKTRRITQKFYFTKGKVEQIAKHIIDNDVDCLFVNAELKPGQLRNLKKVI